MIDDGFWDIFGITDIGDVALMLEVRNIDGKALSAPKALSISFDVGNSSFDNSGDELYNKNGIRIVTKGLVADDWEYSDDIHILLLVENGYSKPIDVDVVYDSLSINGFMLDFYGSSTSAVVGKSAILDITLRGSSLEKNGIKSTSDIMEAEMTFDIKDDNYNTIEKSVISINY
jgi:hypothetical protein